MPGRRSPDSGSLRRQLAFRFRCSFIVAGRDLGIRLVLHRFGLARETQPSQRDIEHDVAVLRRRFVLRLADAVGSILAIAFHVHHRWSPRWSGTPGPEWRAIRFTPTVNRDIKCGLLLTGMGRSWMAVPEVRHVWKWNRESRIKFSQSAIRKM